MIAETLLHLPPLLLQLCLPPSFHTVPKLPGVSAESCGFPLQSNLSHYFNMFRRNLVMYRDVLRHEYVASL